MLLSMTVAGAVVAAFCLFVLLWPFVVQPALRRRYEKEHQRSKVRGRFSR